MAEPPSDRPSLSILGGPMSGKVFVIDEDVDNILVGSDSSCKFHLPLSGVSPIHARIWVDAQGITVYDANSPRGLYVNDDRVVGQSLIRNGDVLWLGAPGDEDGVMMQVRVPPRTHAMRVAVAPPSPAEGETVLLRADAPLPVAEATPEPEPEARPELAEPMEVAADEAPTLIEEPEAAPGPAEPMEVAADEAPTLIEAPEQAPNGFELAPGEPAAFELAPEETPIPVEPMPAAPFEPQAEEPLALEETQVLVAPEEVPTFVTESEREPTRFEVESVPSTSLPPVPTFFEDETAAEPAPAAPQPAPPPIPLLMEEPEPTVAMPPPTPRPAAPRAEPRPAPPPKPPARTTPAPTAAPRPKPAAPKAERPTPAPRPAAPAPRTKAPSAAGRYAVFGVIGLVVLGGGIFGAMQLMKPSAPTPKPTPPPVSVAPATLLPSTVPQTQAEAPATEAPATEPTPPPIEEAVTIVKTATPPPKTADASPAAKPPPTQPPATQPGAKPTAPPPTQAKGPEAPSPEALKAQQVADLLGQADAALASRNYDAAAGLYDQAGKLDPQNAKAQSGKTTALAGAAAAKKTFVAGRTSVQSGSKAGKGPSGFDDSDVSLAKAPDYSGRIEFEASPARVKAGDNYAIKVFLVNDGKKPFKIGGLTATTTVNGARSGGGPAAPSTKEVAPQQRVLLQEVPGIWQEDTKTWALDVTVTSDHNDTFKNTLAWK